MASEWLTERIEALLRANDFGLGQWASFGRSTPQEFTYRFEPSKPADYPSDFAWANYNSLTGYSATEQAVVREVLDEFESFLNVTFVEDLSASDADFSFYHTPDMGSLGGRAWYWFYFSGEWDGHIALNDSRDLTSEWGRYLVRHEVGHTLGLKHPGDYDAGGGTTAGPFLNAREDHISNSVMSYNEDPAHAGAGDSLMRFDIAALQAWWGSNPDTNSGNNSYVMRAGDALKTIWDGGGTDSLVFKGGADVHIRLKPGQFSTVGTDKLRAIAYDVEIENARGGAGDDVLLGNGGKNRLSGGQGDDRLLGAGGRDLLDGGSGNDKLLGGGGRDRLKGGIGDDLIKGGGGADTIVFSVGDGTDRVLGHEAGLDRIMLDSDLWSGDLTANQVVERFGSRKAGNVILQFDEGDALILKGFSDISGLASDIHFL